MPILILNSGSSSMKFSFFEPQHNAPTALHCLLDAELSGIGSGSAATLHVNDPGDTGLNPDAFPQTAHTLAQAIDDVLRIVSRPDMPSVDAIGYRVVHAGSKLTSHTRITPDVLNDIQQAIGFAPLHEPAAIDLIRAGMSRFPSASHYACFDTVFHRTMSEEATTYALPQSIRDQGIRRYGFHGLSCESVLYQLKQTAIHIPHRMVIAHLGSGCSVTAVLNGRSIDTTMGLTPTGGVVMGTRSGDLDPGLLLYLLRQQKGKAADEVETMLNRHSGMVALTLLPNDMKAVRQAVASGAPNATLALKVFTRSITKAIGAYSFLLGGLDLLVFTGGIGEHDSQTRAEILSNTAALGLELDATRNTAQQSGLRAIHASNSRTAVFVIPAEEDLMIAMHVARMAGSEK